MRPIKVIKEKVQSTRYGKMFTERYDFKTTVLSVLSLIINTGFAVTNLVSAIIYDSVLYAALSGYYFSLITFRAIVITVSVKCRKKFRDNETLLNSAENKIQLYGGAFLVITMLCMSAVIAYVTVSPRTARGGKIFTIATAAYAFYKITMSIINLLRARRFGNPVIQSLRNLNFADACMTMVSLTALMLATFQKDNNDRFVTVMIPCVGFAACALTLTLAIYMIINSLRKLKHLK